MDNLGSVLNSLVLVGVVAALAPVIVALLPGPRVPQLVVLILGGIVLGPHGLGVSDPGVLILVANIGLGMVFLLAGYELDPAVFRERAGRLALTGWVITVVLAAGLVGVPGGGGPVLVRATGKLNAERSPYRDGLGTVAPSGRAASRS